MLGQSSDREGSPWGGELLEEVGLSQALKNKRGKGEYSTWRGQRGLIHCSEAECCPMEVLGCQGQDHQTEHQFLIWTLGP